MFEPARKLPAWGSACFAFCGVLFCLANILGQAETLCITAGCDLFKDTKIMGYSVWWLGVAAFSLITFAAVIGKRTAALYFCTMCILGDLIFLLIMALSAPCVPCLIVALIFALLYWSLVNANNKSIRPALLILFVWALLFSSNVFAAFNESTKTWAISGGNTPDMQVFFSPSCPTCNKTIKSLAVAADANYAYFPIAENTQDVSTIHSMQLELARGASFYVAFNRATKSKESHVDSGMIDSLILRWHLFNNKKHLAQLGVTRIPVLITNGVPTSLLHAFNPKTPPSQQTISPTSTPTSGSDIDALMMQNGNAEGSSSPLFAGCADDNAIPCDE